MKTTITSAIIAATFALVSCAAPGTDTATIQPYTSDTCLITDNKLGSMGDPITKIYGNQEVKFCCKPCLVKFNKDPDKYVAELAAATKR